MNRTTTEVVRHQHVPELQSIRGIAALLVMLGHCGSYYIVPQWFHWLVITFANGDASVVLFFVLSGYVLTNLLSKAVLDREKVFIFYLRRLFRLYPALWTASILALVYVAFFHWRIPVDNTSPWFEARFKADRYSLLGIAASLAGALAFLLPPVWSIFVELVGSILMPLFSLAATRRAAFLVIGAALCAFGFVGPHTYYDVGTYVLDFWIGAAGFYAVAEYSAFLSPSIGIQIPAMLIAISVFMGGASVGQSGADAFVTLAYALSAMVLLVAVVRSWAGVGVLRRKILVTLGDWSYSVYLLHFSVMCLIAKGMQLAGASSIPPAARSCLLALLTTIVTIPLSAASYRFVEIPSIALGNRVIGRLRTWRFEKLPTA